MADDEIVKKGITDILNLINRKFEIIDALWLNENRDFEVKFHTEVEKDNDDYNQLCDDWVDLFSLHTNTVWVKKTSNTGPKVKFRKQYQCWTGEGTVQKELLFDPRRCRGVIDMKILTDNQCTRRKNKHIRKGLNVLIKINFNHLHPVDILTPYAFFVHNCEPLQEAPKLVIKPNEKLPKLLQEMIQKGPITSQKAALRAEAKLKEYEKNDMVATSSIVNQNAVVEIHNDSTSLQIIQTNPTLENMENIKLELREPTYTQLVVSTPQMENMISDQFLSCQPIVFDMNQLVPITSQSHYIQVQPTQNINQNEQYL